MFQAHCTTPAPRAVKAYANLRSSNRAAASGVRQGLPSVSSRRMSPVSWCRFGFSGALVMTPSQSRSSLFHQVWTAV